MWKKAVLIVSLALNVVLASYLIYIASSENKPKSLPILLPEAKALFSYLSFGPVPDSLTAIEYAKDVWVPIYGERVLTQEPFAAVLSVDTFWRVSGSLPKGPEGSPTVGGVAHATIRKSDGKLMNVMHGK